MRPRMDRHVDGVYPIYIIQSLEMSGLRPKVVHGQVIGDVPYAATGD